MADIEQFVKKKIDEAVKKDYPHLRLPSVVLAEVTHAELIENLGTRCRLRLLDQNFQIDEKVPEIPEVMSRIDLSQGDVVCVALLYGQLLPYVIGRCIA